jgi:hypothetical protein
VRACIDLTVGGVFEHSSVFCNCFSFKHVVHGEC